MKMTVLLLVAVSFIYPIIVNADEWQNLTCPLINSGWSSIEIQLPAEHYAANVIFNSKKLNTNVGCEILRLGNYISLSCGRHLEGTSHLNLLLNSATKRVVVGWANEFQSFPQRPRLESRCHESNM
jgi:hypothetical protein